MSRKKTYCRKRSTIYRVRNWSAYTSALKQRGSLNIWIGQDVLGSWYATPNGSPGRDCLYSDQAVETALTIRKLFRLPLRQTEGLLTSLIQRLHLPIAVPNYTTLSRRGASLTINLATSHKDEVDIVIDSSGVTVYRAGEWNTKRHGKKKAKRWKKIHVAIDDDGEVRAGEVTEESIHDADGVTSLLSQETASVRSLTADGAYDTHQVYTICQTHSIPQVVIPPRKNARIWQHGNRLEPEHPRDSNLRLMRKQGRTFWKQVTHYHRRSRVEATIFRYKTILGHYVLSREATRQRIELLLGFKILNRMWQLGMPDSYAVTT
jgi:hypothetical protein